MANPLTGDYEAVVQIAIRQINGLLGTMHQNAAIAATYGTDLKQAVMWVALVLFITLVCPNTLQILAPYEPALGVKPASTAPIVGKLRIPAWGPSLPWAVVVSVVASVAVFTLGGPSEFLYWQF